MTKLKGKMNTTIEALKELGFSDEFIQAVLDTETIDSIVGPLILGHVDIEHSDSTSLIIEESDRPQSLVVNQK
jgi:hypothetical protein